MKKLSLILLAVASAGCSLSMKAERNWCAGKDSAPPVVVTGTQEASGLTRILFDGQPVLEADLPMSGDGAFEGKWQGQTVLAVCGRRVSLGDILASRGDCPTYQGGDKYEGAVATPGPVNTGGPAMGGSDPRLGSMPMVANPEFAPTAPTRQPPRYCAVKVGEHYPFTLQFENK